MENIQNCEDLLKLRKNRFEGALPAMFNSQVVFHGTNNMLICGKGVSLANSTLHFRADNSLVYLRPSQHPYYLNVTTYHDSVLYLGDDNYFNGRVSMILSEQKNIVIGNSGLFSFDVWMRLADPHLVYDCDTKNRINPSKSIYVGDHVWIGQHAMILKGTQIGSGSIVGGMAVVANKTIPSNSCWAGNPAKRIANRIFYTGGCVHAYRNSHTAKSMQFDSNDYIYEHNSGKTLAFDEIDGNLNALPSAESKWDYLKETVDANKSKNRFYVGDRLK